MSSVFISLSSSKLVFKVSSVLDSEVSSKTLLLSLSSVELGASVSLSVATSCLTSSSLVWSISTCFLRCSSFFLCSFSLRTFESIKFSAKGISSPKLSI